MKRNKEKGSTKILLTVGILILILLAVALYILIAKRMVENLFIKGIP
jgi:hypothetical protein